MSIQREQAFEKKLHFSVNFTNIKEEASDWGEEAERESGGVGENKVSPIIRSDEHRIMQVLLGL